jgi:hypothetical protein
MSNTKTIIYECHAEEAAEMSDDILTQSCHDENVRLRATTFMQMYGWPCMNVRHGMTLNTRR